MTSLEKGARCVESKQAGRAGHENMEGATLHPSSYTIRAPVVGELLALYDTTLFLTESRFCGLPQIDSRCPP